VGKFNVSLYFGIGLANISVLLANVIDWKATFAIVGVSGLLVTAIGWIYMRKLDFKRYE